jgi:hypothetical protein
MKGSEDDDDDGNKTKWRAQIVGGGRGCLQTSFTWP